MIINPGNETFERTFGQNVTFSCLRDGNPSPTVTWTKNDSDFIDWKSSNVTFQVNGTNYGWYLCTVENELNVASKWFHLSK